MENSLQMNRILQRQTCLEKLIVIDTSPRETNFLTPNNCDNSQFHLKSFIYFEYHISIEFAETLGNFLESQQESLRIVALNTLQELFHEHEDADQLMGTLKNHLRYINGLEGANLNH